MYYNVLEMDVLQCFGNGCITSCSQMGILLWRLLVSLHTFSLNVKLYILENGITEDELLFKEFSPKYLWETFEDLKKTTQAWHC